MTEHKITPYNAWVLSNTIRIHFKTKSDIKGLMYSRFTLEKFEKAGERFFCKRLVDNYLTSRNISIYIASNLVYNPDIWFNSLETEECRNRYFSARKILDAPLHSLQNVFSTSIHFEELLEGDTVPKFVSELLNGNMTPEHICILDIVSPFMSKCVSEKENNLIVVDMVNRLLKYKKFCNIQNIETRNEIIKLININGE